MLIMAAVLSSVSLWPQGLIMFHNRELSPQTSEGGTYSMPLGGNWRAQLYLVTPNGWTVAYRPLYPIQTNYDDPPFALFFREPVTVTVDGHEAGATGLIFIVRVWSDAETYEEAAAKTDRNIGESNFIIVNRPLGGTNETSVFQPPDLGGPTGWQRFCGGCLPESFFFRFIWKSAEFPNSMGIEGERFRFNVSLRNPFPWITSGTIEASSDFQVWTPVATIATPVDESHLESFTIPYEPQRERHRFYRLRTPP